jgi:N-sulfoglucosamine sulfohydrolase
MNVFPIRSVRIGLFKYIHNLPPDTWFTNHSDRHRKDGAGAFWDSWDAAAKKDPKAADIVRRYYTRPEFEFFDLADDPMELHNLAEETAHQETIARCRSELAEWARSQGDALLPHRSPYPRAEPIPDLSDQRKK